jgi:hypothetical protein
MSTVMRRTVDTRGVGDQSAGDVLALHPENYTVDELREVLFGTSERLPKVIAISLMRLKDYPEAVTDLERIALAEEQSPRTRRHAAIELARVPSADATAALQRIASNDRTIVAETAQQELHARSQARPATTSDLPDWPAQLAAFRARDPATRLRLPPSERLLELDPKLAHELSIETPDPDEVKRALDHLAGAGSGRFQGEGAIGLRGRATQVLYLPSPSVQVGFLKELLSRPAEVGSVAFRFPQEVDRWELVYHVLTQPELHQQDVVEIVLVRPNGQVAFVGNATLRDATAEFRVSAVDVPGAFAVDVSGTISERGVVLHRALASTAATTVVPQPRSR